MAENSYFYTSNKDEWDQTQQVIAARDADGNPSKVLVKGGDPVELTEDERARVAERFNLRKASDSQVEAAQDSQAESTADASGQQAGNNDNTSAGPDPAANKATSGPRSR